jgi:hypothetical protein
MGQYKLIINPFAEKDLQISTDWYNHQKENLGNDFLVEVENSLQKIQTNPLQFPVVKNSIRRAVLKRFPFGIYFFVKKDIINVFAIFHFSRNPLIWKRRMK